MKVQWQVTLGKDPRLLFVSPIPPLTSPGDHLNPPVDPVMPSFIHDFMHGIITISNHSVPLLSMKEHMSRPWSEKERWAVSRAHD
jgi:hypothetical protein